MYDNPEEHLAAIQANLDKNGPYPDENHCYMLVDCRPVKVGMARWIQWRTNFNATIERTKIHGFEVSTFYGGRDHSLGKGPLLLFTTRICFGTLEEPEHYDTATWEDAMALHQEILSKLHNLMN